jgi:hypothetical protein
MSFVYYSLVATEGPALINAEKISNGFWTTPLLLSQFITYLTQLDFADYDSRRLALEYINKLRIPKFFNTYSFDPLAYPLVPPSTQTRFPPFGTYVYLGTSQWLTALQNISSPLAYRDSDGPINTPLLNFTAGLAVIDQLNTDSISFYDRITFELVNILVWSLYPPPPLTAST